MLVLFEKVSYVIGILTIFKNKANLYYLMPKYIIKLLNEQEEKVLKGNNFN
jgi:hypothetical protein